MATAFGYARCSTQDQKDSGLGLEAQKQRIENYYQYRLAQKGLEWGGLFVDAAVSASKIPFAEREAGDRLNTGLRHGDHIVFANLDRGFRRVTDCLLTVDKWRDRGVVLHALDLNVDTSTPTGELILGVMAHFAQWERRRIGERTAAAVKIARQNGKAANGFAGYGFRWVGAKSHKRRVPDPEERATMKRIVKSRCDGCSWETIYFDFLKLGIKTREGKEWSLSRIYRAFKAELVLMTKEAATRNGNSVASSPAPTKDA